jgi:hypothetical protein
MTCQFIKSDDYDADILGDDLVLMNNKTREVLTLNPTARAVWDMLEEDLSQEEIREAFESAFADIDSAILHKDINRTLDHLLTSGLLVKSEGAS